MKYQAKIKRDGTLEFLGAPPPRLALPGATKQRFSEIVPVHPVLLVAFRVLRWMFGEEGRVSDWTRTWKCWWEATILIGPVRGRKARQWGKHGRAHLIEWEQRQWRHN